MRFLEILIGLFIGFIILMFIVQGITNFIGNQLDKVSLPSISLFQGTTEMNLGGVYTPKPKQQIPLEIKFNGPAIARIVAAGKVTFYCTLGGAYSTLFTTTQDTTYAYILSKKNVQIQGFVSHGPTVVDLQILPFEAVTNSVVRFYAFHKFNVWVDTKIEVNKGDFAFLEPINGIYGGSSYPYRLKIDNGAISDSIRLLLHDLPELGRGVNDVSHIMLPASGRLYVLSEEQVWDWGFWGHWGSKKSKEVKITVYHTNF